MYSEYLHEDLVLFGRPFDPKIRCSHEMQVENGTIIFIEKHLSK